jgi:hypothetical protein
MAFKSSAGRRKCRLTVANSICITLFVNLAFSVGHLKTTIGNPFGRPRFRTADEFKAVALRGEIMSELEKICANKSADSVALLWKDYPRVIELARKESEPSPLMFERLYEIHKNPVRIENESQAKSKFVVKFTDHLSESEMAHAVITMKHFTLIDRESYK